MQQVARERLQASHSDFLILLGRGAHFVNPSRPNTIVTILLVGLSRNADIDSQRCVDSETSLKV